MDRGRIRARLRSRSGAGAASTGGRFVIVGLGSDCTRQRTGEPRAGLLLLIALAEALLGFEFGLALGIFLDAMTFLFRLATRFRSLALRPLGGLARGATLGLFLRMAALQRAGRTSNFLLELEHDTEVDEETKGSLAEIAQLTGVGVETVKSRLRYAISKLRMELRELCEGA